jgi:tRNA U34 5-carboxymethylaminomethyl modifying GTPase MnmE/TrmE
MAKKNETPAEKPAASKAEEAVAAQYASRIEAVKELIFGEDNAEIRQRLGELDQKIDERIEDLNNKLSDIIADLEKATNNRIDNLEMDLKAEIDRLDDNKTDRFKLGKMLEEIGKTLQEK